jgi:hypothetical protein
MFNQLFKSPSATDRHASAPYPEERQRYLTACAQQGDSRSTLLLKARDLFWVACNLSVYRDLQRVTVQQVRAVANDWKKRERACRRKLNTPSTRLRFMRVAIASPGFDISGIFLNPWSRSHSGHSWRSIAGGPGMNVGSPRRP